MTRSEHLAWCKERALARIDSGEAVASMLSDLGKWDGGQLYDPMLLNTMAMDGMMFRRTPDEIRGWVEGFN